MAAHDQHGAGSKLGLVTPSAGRRAYWVVVTVCALLALSDLLYHKHGHYRWEEWFAFHGWYGFVGSVGLVLTAKLLRKVLMRDEDYYDR